MNKNTRIISMQKRSKPIAGVGTEQHKEALRRMASRVRMFPPSESSLVCMAVLYMDDSLEQGKVTFEDLHDKYHQAVFG
jgi:hypothetical protein